LKEHSIEEENLHRNMYRQRGRCTKKSSLLNWASQRPQLTTPSNLISYNLIYLVTDLKETEQRKQLGEEHNDNLVTSPPPTSAAASPLPTIPAQ